MGNRAGYGEHYLLPYRGADENVTYDFVIMRHYYSVEARSNLIASWPEYRDMMNKSGYWNEFQRIASCGPISTFFFFFFFLEQIGYITQPIKIN